MELSGKKIAALIGEGFQDQEALEPIDFLKSEGAEVTIVGESKGKVGGLHGAVLEIEKTFEDSDPVTFHAIFIPGGRSPAYLRKFPEAIGFVKTFAGLGRPVFAICHAGQLLAAAGLVEGLTLTGSPGIKEEMERAGADFVDQPTVVDRNILSSRLPEDIPEFEEKMRELLLKKPQQEVA
jgi:protease I